MEFFDTLFLEDDEIKLCLDRITKANEKKNYVPAYHFSICNKFGTEMGICDLRIGHNDNLYFGGNIGFKIYKRYRGHHYAAKACLLLFNLARKHNLEYLYITCNPENIASRKTCEYVGGILMEVATLPANNEMRVKNSETKKCIYKINLN